MPARHRLPSPVEAWWRRHRPQGLALTGAVVVGVVVTAGTVAGVAVVRHGHPAAGEPPTASVRVAEPPGHRTRAGHGRSAGRVAGRPVARRIAGAAAQPRPPHTQPAAAPTVDAARRALVSPGPAEPAPTDSAAPSPSVSPQPSPSGSPTPSSSESPSSSPSPSPSHRGFPWPLGRRG